MKFGSFMEFHTRQGMSQHTAFSESFKHILQAEEFGLDGIWLAESHFTPGRSVLSSPLILASAIAERTKRIKIGTAVHILPLANPLKTAEETATLDHLCGGRFEFGIGRSGLPSSYEGFNIPYAESRQRFFEYLDIILKAWTKEKFSHNGEFFRFNEVCLVPKPLQSPHPVIRIATTTTDTFPIIGKMGFPIFTGLRGLGISEVADQVESYIEAWNEAKHTGPLNIFLRVPVYVASKKDRAIRDPEVSFMRQFRRLGSQLALSSSHAGSETEKERILRINTLANITWNTVLKEKVVVGTPAMVIERLQEMKEVLHLDGIIAEFNAGELIPPELIESSLKLFCSEVMPAFR